MRTLIVRYNKITKVVTAWRGPDRLIDRGRDDEAIVFLDIPIPEKSPLAWLYDEATKTLIPNPNYVEPKPVVDLLAEIKENTVRIVTLEKI